MSQLKRLYREAIRFETLEERIDFIVNACGDDAQLRQRLEAMVRDHSVDDTDPLGDFIDSMAAVSEATPSVPSKIGGYEIRSKIGEGGMGAVYCGHHPKLSSEVAIKVIKPGMDTEQVLARFRAEQEALSMMDHPHIARALSAGMTQQGRPFFVMEFVEGISITRFCEQNQLGLCDRLNLFLQVCRAVHHAHQKGVIHRDLKPSNLLAHQGSDGPIVKVIDFGVAKALSQDLANGAMLTHHLQLIGTPAYMSPEQAAGVRSDVDTRSDIYSLGVLLYTLLTGKPPLGDTTIDELGLDEFRRLVQQVVPPRPSQSLTDEVASSDSAGAVRELDWIVLKAIEKDRDRRYATVNEFADDLKRFLDGEPVAACPPTFSYLTRKWVANNLIAVAASSIVLITLALATLMCVASAVDASNARELADQRLVAEIEARRRADENRRDAERAQRIAMNQADEQQRLREVAETARKRAEETLYIADMARASRCLRDGDVAQTARILDAYRTNEPRRDLRDFSWYFLDQSISADQVGRYSVSTEIWRMETSPDQTQLAIAAMGQIQIVDVQTRSIRRRLTAAVQFRDVAWSPDGSRLAASAFDGKVRVWEFAEEEPAASDGPGGIAPLSPTWHFDAHEGGALAVCYSHDGRVIFSGGYDDMIRSWDAETGTLLSEFVGHGREVVDLSLSPDGKIIASASADMTVRLWDVESETQIRSWRSPSDALMWCVDFSDDGEHIAFGDNDGNLGLANIASKNVAFVDLPDTIYDVTVDQNSIAASDRSGCVQLRGWSSGEAGQPKIRLRATKHWQVGNDRARGLCLIDDSVIVGLRNGTVSHWTAASLSPKLSRIGAEVCLLSDDRLAVASYSVERFTLAGDRLDDVAPWGNAWRAIASATDVDRLSVIGFGGTVRVYDSSNGDLVVSWKYDRPPRRVDISPDGSRVAISWFDEAESIEIVEIADTSKPNRVRLFTKQCRSMKFSPDGRTIAVGHMDDIFIYDFRSGELLHHLRGHTGGMNDVAFSPDGETLASVGHDRRLILWDTATGEQISSARTLQDFAWSVEIAHAGNRVVTGGRDGSVIIWDRDTLQPMLEIPVDGSISNAFFSSDDQSLIVRTWDWEMLIFRVSR